MKNYLLSQKLLVGCFGVGLFMFASNVQAHVCCDSSTYTCRGVFNCGECVSGEVCSESGVCEDEQKCCLGAHPVCGGGTCAVMSPDCCIALGGNVFGASTCGPHPNLACPESCSPPNEEETEDAEKTAVVDEEECEDEEEVTAADDSNVVDSTEAVSSESASELKFNCQCTNGDPCCDGECCPPGSFCAGGSACISW